MGAVRQVAALVATLTLATASPARADPVDQWRDYISEASFRFGIPQAWIIRVMWIESGGKTVRGGRPTTSRAGAMGLMQLMPATWGAMRAALGLGDDPHDPRDNIIAGTAYLRLMYDRFGYPGLFGAYNAGPGRYGAYTLGRSRLPQETTAYLALATGRAGSTRPAYIAANHVTGLGVTGHPDHLFFAVRTPQTVSLITPAITNLPAQAGLFVRLNTAPGTQ